MVRKMGKVIRVSNKVWSYLESIGKFGQTPGELIDALIPVAYQCDKCGVILSATDNQLRVWVHCPCCGDDISRLKKIGITRESTENKSV
jgi:hypothetical protein